MKHKSSISERAYRAIIEGWKTIEIRTNTSYEKIDYSKVKAGDTIEFEVSDSLEKPSRKRIVITVKAIRHYPSARALLEKEGIEHTCSWRPPDLESAAKGILNISQYEQSVPLHGLFAIEIENYRKRGKNKRT